MNLPAPSFRCGRRARRAAAGATTVPDPMPAPRPAEGRVSTGNPGVDAMLDGGLVPHRPYLIVGPSGTGKTTLALQFLCEGVRRGERTLLVTLEEPPNEARRNHRLLSTELDRVEVFDAIPDVMRYERAPFKDIASVREIAPFGRIGPEIRKSPELTSVEVTITALEQMLRSEVIRRNYSRIAIDSLTALQYFCMKGFEPIGGAQTFLRFLSDLRTTTVLTVESPLEDVETAERMLARGEIRLFRWELDGVTVRAIGVEKFRGSSHDVRLHPYRIGSQGIDVNLAVTISRDTRQIIVVPAPLAIPLPEPRSAVLRATLEPLSDELHDLVALGIDIHPVRGALEAALAAVRGGRSAEAVQQISRLTSMTSALAASTVGAESASHATEPAAADAYRRIAQRAETLRVGLPPTLLPPPDVLEEQLAKVLSLLPAPRPATPSVARGVGPGTGATPAPPTFAEERTAPSAPPPAPPAGSPTAPKAPPRGRAAGPQVPGPAAGRPAPRRAAGAFPVPEPPPLPHAMPRPAPEAPAPSAPPRGAAPERPPSPPRRSPTAAAGASPAPPPLPHVALPDMEPPAPVAPVAVVVPAKRRRRAAAPRKRTGPPAEGPSEPGAAAPADATPASPTSKPRRRAVRKRKAPTVVAATPEALSSDETKPAPPSPPPAEGE